MVSVSEAKNLVKNKVPEAKTIRVYDMNKDLYLVYASDVAEGDTDYGDPYYLVNKNTKNVSGFVPSMNFDAYSKAIQNGELKMDNELKHHGTKDMRWGYTKGRRNGKHTAKIKEFYDNASAQAKMNALWDVSRRYSDKDYDVSINESNNPLKRSVGKKPSKQYARNHYPLPMLRTRKEHKILGVGSTYGAVSKGNSQKTFDKWLKARDKYYDVEKKRRERKDKQYEAEKPLNRAKSKAKHFINKLFKKNKKKSKLG